MGTVNIPDFVDPRFVLEPFEPAPATDQRGVPRPQGTDADIGAFEVETASEGPAPANLTVESDGHETLSVSYEVVGMPSGAFDISVYRSIDGVVDGGDELLDTLSIVNSPDLTVGAHTLPFTIGGGPGELALPGAGATETDNDYRLLFETDSAAFQFAGVYQVGSNPIFVHGTEDADTLTVSSGPLQVVANGDTFIYGDLSELRVRHHAGDDSLVTGSGVDVRTLVFGGLGDDTMTTGSGNDTLFGGGGPSAKIHFGHLGGSCRFVR